MLSPGVGLPMENRHGESSIYYHNGSRVPIENNGAGFYPGSVCMTPHIYIYNFSIRTWL